MRYTFELHDGGRPIRDDTSFAVRELALAHADTVVLELMKHCEPESRSWRLDVFEGDMLVRQLLFASVDPTLDHLDPALRMTVGQSNATLLASMEAQSSARVTRRETRALAARSRGKPYLATERGEPTIRTSPKSRQP
jgi:hypothetical protein